MRDGNRAASFCRASTEWDSMEEWLNSLTFVRPHIMVACDQQSLANSIFVPRTFTH